MSGMCTLVCNLNPTWKTRTPASMETTLERSTFTIQTDCFQYSITCSDRFFFFFLSRRSSDTSRRLSLFWRPWLLKMTSWWIYVERSGGRNAKLNTNHFKHLSYLLHFTLLGFLLSKQIFSYLIMHLTDVQINLGIFTKTLVCDHTSHLPPPPLLLPTNLIPSSRFHGQFYLALSQRDHHQFFTTFHVPFLCRYTAKLPIQVIK